eukprot:334469-Karenia_brevis.AAC.1
MHMLRQRIEVRTPRDQAVAVVRRMPSDLEMKGVFEVQAMCVNLRPDVNMFQECVRTLMTTSFPGGIFMHRL